MILFFALLKKLLLVNWFIVLLYLQCFGLSYCSALACASAVLWPVLLPLRPKLMFLLCIESMGGFVSWTLAHGETKRDTWTSGGPQVEKTCTGLDTSQKDLRQWGLCKRQTVASPIHSRTGVLASRNELQVLGHK